MTKIKTERKNRFKNNSSDVIDVINEFIIIKNMKNNIQGKIFHQSLILINILCLTFKTSSICYYEGEQTQSLLRTIVEPLKYNIFDYLSLNQNNNFLLNSKNTLYFLI